MYQKITDLPLVLMAIKVEELIRKNHMSTKDFKDLVETGLEPKVFSIWKIMKDLGLFQ